MKKIIIIALAALLAVVSAFAVVNEEPETEMAEVQEVFLISGEIMEIGEDSILINAGEAGMVQANIAEETIMETTGELAVGDYVHVDYDGKMTRSIPAQITAQVIRCYIMEGEISEMIDGENAALIETETHGQVYVHLPEDNQAELQAGDSIKVYFNGAMTMSLPGQINADKIA